MEKMPRPRPSSVPKLPSVMQDDDLDAQIAELEQALLDSSPQKGEIRDEIVDLPDAEVDQRISDLESMLPGSQSPLNTHETLKNSCEIQSLRLTELHEPPALRHEGWAASFADVQPT